VPDLVATGCEAPIAGAETDPPAGAVDAEEAVSLLLSAFEPLFPRWITRLNLKTIPDYTTVTTLILLIVH
jgi:hypothetical protein